MKHGAPWTDPELHIIAAAPDKQTARRELLRRGFVRTLEAVKSKRDQLRAHAAQRHPQKGEHPAAGQTTGRTYSTNEIGEVTK